MNYSYCRKISVCSVSNFRLISQKMSFQLDFVLGAVPNASTRAKPDSITAQFKSASISICVLSDMNHYFHNFHTIYEVNILFRSSMGSLADFDMNSTSEKHIQRTHMCVIARCHITR